MEEYMRDCMRKLALWHSRTFNPIMTHEELEPIMAAMGFVSLPPSNAWKEYAYLARSSVSEEEEEKSPPRPKLPYPKIDGLHVYTYQAFIDAVNFYVRISDISDLFHVRGMPLHRINDRSKKWRRMGEDGSVFVYREGTLDQATYNFYHLDNPRSNEGDSIAIRNKGNKATVFCVVPLKDIIVNDQVAGKV